MHSVICFFKPNTKLTIICDHTLILNTTLFNYRIATIDLINIEALFESAKSLPEVLQSHINQRKLPQDKACSIQGWLLLKACLQERGLTSDDILENIQFNAFGKPCLKKSRLKDASLDAHFNFSHSHAKVVCAVSNTHRIGVDIEKIGVFDNSLLPAYFSHGEIDFITQANYPEDAFFSFWTKKEALLKCVGIGIAHIELASLEVLNNTIIYKQKPYRFYSIDVGHSYMAHVCIEEA